MTHESITRIVSLSAQNISHRPVEGADEDRVNPKSVIVHAAVTDLRRVRELDGEGKLNVEESA